MASTPLLFPWTSSSYCPPHPDLSSSSPLCVAIDLCSSSSPCPSGPSSSSSSSPLSSSPPQPGLLRYLSCLCALCAFLSLVLFLIFHARLGPTFLGRSIPWRSDTTPLYFRERAAGADGPPLLEVAQDVAFWQSERIVLCGLLRDKEGQVAYLRESLRQVTKHFADWALVVVENGSVDRTRQLLLDWQQEEPDRVFVLEGAAGGANVSELVSWRTVWHDYSEQRIGKMAALRNVYLQFVQQHARLSSYAYLAVLDLDLRSLLYSDGLLNSAHHFHTNPTIQAIAANGLQLTAVRFTAGRLHRLTYQDPYAHEDSGNSGKPHDQRYDNVRSGLVNKFKYGHQLLPVTSAFSGFTIYRARALMGLRYGVERSGLHGQHVLCEHVSLNRQLQAVYLNPSMLHIILDNADGGGADEQAGDRQALNVVAQVLT